MQRGEKGSPPRMRGKLMPPTVSIIIARITPADAGKTFCRRLRRACTRDHPRRCGENSGMAASRVRHDGSPPQVRGKRADVPVQAGAKRITPAGAGKTCLPRRFRHTRQDHPRRCGENAGVKSVTRMPAGSPPQVRGKQWTEGEMFDAARITPAGAGKTPLRQ